MNFLVSIFLVASLSINGIIKHAHLKKEWYPKTTKKLNDKLDIIFKGAKFKYNAPVTKVRAIIAPHAGIKYSGKVAASVHRLVTPSKVDRVIVLAPSHRYRYQGVALPDFSEYRTPLGSVHVDTEAVNELAKHRGFAQYEQAFEPEHSLEMQLPFLQKVLGDKFKLVPLIVGDVKCNPAHIANTLKKIMTPKTLVVVSSDFTHHGPRFGYEPFKDNPKDRLRALDGKAIEKIQEQKNKPFCQFLDKTKATICGRNPIKILLSMLEQKAFGKPLEARLVAYDTSGSKTDNYNNSVSYVGLAFTEEKLKDQPLEYILTDFEKNALKDFAENYLRSLYDSYINLNLIQPIKSPGLLLNNGVFVTLRKNGQLRGCIGRILTDKPIHTSVKDMTKSAAQDDLRFPEVTADELKNITLEIAVLDIPREVKNVYEVQIPGDGVILTQGARKAVYLPEVAKDQGWNKQLFMESLSEKAGLPRTDWQNPKTKFKVFRSNKF